MFLADVARVRGGADQPASYAWFGAPPGRAGPAAGLAPAVTIAVAKKPGANAADITRAIEARVESLRGLLIPAGVEVTITRDYGRTADDKAGKLIQKLLMATLSVVVLVLLALGWREAVVVGTAVVITLALTLFASWAMGFTLNRVSLFALIFSIGILVDDAIVVVENIHRHRARHGGTLLAAIPPAVDEVGGPTILATFTVIAALLPMAFVSGLMGPYMRPIPINASAGMLLSLAVALVVTPWLALHLLRRGHDDAGKVGAARTKARAAGWRACSSAACAPSSPARRRRGAGACCSPPWSAWCWPRCRWWRCSGWCSRCCPSTTSRSSRSWSTCPRARAWSAPTRCWSSWRARSTTWPKCATTRATPAPRRR